MTTRKLSMLMGLAFVLLAMVAGCTLITGDTQNVNQNIVGPSGLSPSPGSSPPPAGCLPIDHIRVTLKAGGGPSVRINTDNALDATPIDTSGKQADFACHGHTVTWTTQGTALCNVYGDGFNPTLRCSTIGGVTVKAVVSSPGGEGDAPFQVVP